uniref:G domain-containing protein n=1 Tax=Amphimedon queenslandica TaxID=400682 RepID=A0A1X7TN07_AMPQE
MMEGRNLGENAMAEAMAEEASSSNEAEALSYVVEQLNLALEDKHYQKAIPLLQNLIKPDSKAKTLPLEQLPQLTKYPLKYDFRGLTFLHYAVQGNHVDVVRYLIDECGWDPRDFIKYQRMNSYIIAVECESFDVLKYLLSPCSRPTDFSLTSLPCKIVQHIDTLKCLINDCDIDPSKRYGNLTLLHYAAREGSVDVLKYLIYDYNCDPMYRSDNVYGWTTLHWAAIAQQSKNVEFLLSTGKCDLLAKDEEGRTPFCYGNIETRSIFKKFGRIKMSHPVDSYVNVLFVGNPGAGKSSLSHVVNHTASFTLLGSLRNVGGVVPCTAGIIPYKLQHRTLGNIILHDFAGHSEYYSSHSAVIENLLQGSGGVFLIVVNILEKEAVKQLHRWLTVVRNEAQKTLHQCHTIVVVSHVDEIHDSVQRRRKEEIREIIMREMCDSVLLDCRKLGGDGMGSFFNKLSSACESIRNKSGRNLSLYCHMMYGLLEERKENILTLEYTNSSFYASKHCDNYVLPNDKDEVAELLHSLHLTGLISILKSEDKVWVILNKGILLTEVNGILFAPETFKEHINIASNTGIVSVSGLTRLFPKYDPDMLICFLKNMELCQEIHPSFLKLTNLHQLAVEDVETSKEQTERLLYFPCLLSSDRPKEMTNQVYQFGWCLQCTDKHHFFPPRYFHVLSLHLAFKLALPQEDDKLNRRCTLWRNGLYWFNGHGVGSLVETVDESQCVLVMMSCKKGYSDNMVSLRRDVIGEVMSVYKESCPALEVKELVIDPKDLAYPVNTPRERTVYSVKDILSVIEKREEFLVNATGTSCKEVTEILPCESLLDINDISLLGGHNIEADEGLKSTKTKKKEEHGSTSKHHSDGQFGTDVHDEKGIEVQETQTDKLLEVHEITDEVKETLINKLLDLAKVIQELTSNQQFDYTDWYQLGLYLGLYERTLKAIEDECRGKLKKCLIECISCWLKGKDGVRETRGGGSNWISLVAALDAMGETEVANNIRINNFDHNVTVKIV